VRTKSKSFLRAFVILIAVLVLTLSLLSTTKPINHGQPLDFYGVSREVSLDEMVDTADRFNQSIYMPLVLPDNLKLTTIYLKDSPFIAIVVYSAEGNKDYKTAELTIQITPSPSPPTYNELVSQVENSKNEIVQEINSWPVLVNEKAYVGGDIETQNKYGDYLPLVTAWIDGMRYMISIRTMRTTDATEMVSNMHLLTA